MDIGYIRQSPYCKYKKQLKDLSCRLHALFFDWKQQKYGEATALDRLFDVVQEGDVVHVQSFDRLGTNMRDFARVLNILQEKKVGLVLYDEGLVLPNDPNDPKAIETKGYVDVLAAWEQAVEDERKANEHAAKCTGKPTGRPSTVSPAQKEAVLKALREDISCNLTKLSRDTGVPKTSCFRLKQRVLREREGD